MDVSKMKVADLKKELKVRGLSTVGNKQELSDRLLGALDTSTDNSLALDDDTNVEDDDLGGDDEEEGIDDLTDDVAIGLDVDPIPTAVIKPAKKIALQRNNLPALEKENVVKEGATSEEKEDDQKVVNVKKVALTAEERLALRAQKFGTSSAEPSKTELRAARFGTGGKETSISQATGMLPSLDVLKRRAERFGTCSSLLEKAEVEERKQQRQQRFGLAEPASTTAKVSLAAVKSASTAAAAAEDSSAAVGSKRPRITGPGGAAGPITAPADDEKKRLRAERFKMVK